jgi:hypothetical protein
LIILVIHYWLIHIHTNIVLSFHFTTRIICFGWSMAIWVTVPVSVRTLGWPSSVASSCPQRKGGGGDVSPWWYKNNSTTLTSHLPLSIFCSHCRLRPIYPCCPLHAPPPFNTSISLLYKSFLQKWISIHLLHLLSLVRQVFMQTNFRGGVDYRGICTINPDGIEKTMTFQCVNDSTISFTVLLSGKLVTVILQREVAGDFIMEKYGLVRHAISNNHNTAFIGFHWVKTKRANNKPSSVYKGWRLRRLLYRLSELRTVNILTKMLCSNYRKSIYVEKITICPFSEDV